MIEEVVNSILDAEDVAKRRIAEAEAKAGDIIAAAEAEASAYKKNVAAENKTAFTDKMRSADSLAEQQAAERLAELNKKTDEQVSAYAKNVDKAVKIIIEAN